MIHDFTDESCWNLPLFTPIRQRSSSARGLITHTYKFTIDTLDTLLRTPNAKLCGVNLLQLSRSEQ